MISNSLVHQLHKPEVFWEELKRLGKPGAAVFVMDLIRPDSDEEAKRLVESKSNLEAVRIDETYLLITGLI